MGIAPDSRHNRIVPLLARDSPVLIFEVDAAGVAEQAAPARRCNVRLIGCLREKPSEASDRSPHDELSAVLILRALTPSRLLSCVRAVTRGRASIAPELLCQMFPADEDGSPSFGPRALTKRELSVLRMLADGEDTRGIAARLNYSERTVKNVVREVLLKLGCRTRAHAVALATRQGVI